MSCSCQHVFYMPVTQHLKWHEHERAQMLLMPSSLKVSKPKFTTFNSLTSEHFQLQFDMFQISVLIFDSQCNMSIVSVMNLSKSEVCRNQENRTRHKIVDSSVGFLLIVFRVFHAAKHEKNQVEGSKKVLSTLCKIPSCLWLLDPKNTQSMSMWHVNLNKFKTAHALHNSLGAAFLFHDRGNIRFEIRAFSFWVCTSEFPACWLFDPSGWIISWLSAKRLDWIGFHTLFFKNRVVCSLPLWLANLQPGLGTQTSAGNGLSNGVPLPDLRIGTARPPGCSCWAPFLPTRMMANGPRLHRRPSLSHPLWDY